MTDITFSMEDSEATALRELCARAGITPSSLLSSLAKSVVRTCDAPSVAGNALRLRWATRRAMKEGERLLADTSTRGSTFAEFAEEMRSW